MRWMDGTPSSRRGNLVGFDVYGGWKEPGLTEFEEEDHRYNSVLEKDDVTEIEKPHKQQ